jgi:hypothetical protein
VKHREGAHLLLARRAQDIEAMNGAASSPFVGVPRRVGLASRAAADRPD